MAVRRLNPEQPADFALTPENLDWAKAQIGKYPAGRQASAVIPILWRAQEQNDGWLPEPAIRYVAEMLAMPYIRVLEVATFYTMFQLAPVGRKAHVQVCGTTPCMLRGSEDIIKVCKSKIAAHAHALSSDGDFSWEEVECLGACANAPMVQIWKDTYEDLTPETFEQLLDDIAAGKPVTPGPQNGRRFAMPADGPTSLTDIDDDTVGGDPVPHVVDGAPGASKVFAGSAINGGTVISPANANVAPAPGVAAITPAAANVTPDVGSDVKPVAITKSDAELPAPVTGEDTSGKPDMLAEPRGGKADDFKRIKGVGARIEKKLHEMGIYHFDQIAGWSDADKAWVDANLNFRGRIDRENWIEQARQLADDGETEFSKRVDSGNVPTSKG